MLIRKGMATRMSMPCMPHVMKRGNKMPTLCQKNKLPGFWSCSPWSAKRDNMALVL
jgi:hypothetical protein